MRSTVVSSSCNINLNTSSNSCFGGRVVGKSSEKEKLVNVATENNICSSSPSSSFHIDISIMNNSTKEESLEENSSHMKDEKKMDLLVKQEAAVVAEATAAAATVEEETNKLKIEEDEGKREEVIEELNKAIKSQTKNLSKTQEAFFVKMAKDAAQISRLESSNSVDNLHSSLCSVESLTSISSLKKATEYLKECTTPPKTPQNTRAKSVPITKKDVKESVVLFDEHEDFHKNLWLAHEQGIFGKKLLELAASTAKKEKKGGDKNLVKSTLSRAISAPTGPPVSSYYFMKNESVGEEKSSSPPPSAAASKPISSSLKAAIIDDLLTPRRSNLNTMTSKSNFLSRSIDNVGLHLPDFEEDDDDTDIDTTITTNDEILNVMNIVSENTTLLSNTDIDNDSLHEDDDAKFKINKKETMKLYVTDRLNRSSLLQNHYNEGLDLESTTSGGSRRLRHRSLSFTMTPVVRETTSTGKGFEVIPPDYNMNIIRSSSISSFYTNDASSICTETTYDSLSSIRHLLTSMNTSSLGNTKQLNSAGFLSIPSLHRCDANEYDDHSVEKTVLDQAFILNSNDSNSTMSKHRRSSSVPSIANYHEAFMRPSALADDLTNYHESRNTQDLFSRGGGTELDESRVLSDDDDDDDDEEETTEQEEIKTNPSHILSEVPILPKNIKEFEKEEQLDEEDTRSEGNATRSSWTINTEEQENFEGYNAWDMLNDEYCESQKAEITFGILGTSSQDTSAQPHVLSPPLMDSIRNFLPEKLCFHNYWLKYSLVRDGANLRTLLHNARPSYPTLLCIETMTGHVFGCFTTSPWKLHYGYFGFGADSFVWKMKQPRPRGNLTQTSNTHSLLEQIHLESEIEVFSYTGKNDMIQVCKHNLLAIGGGTLENSLDIPEDMLPSVNASIQESDSSSFHMGFAIALNDDFSQGTTSVSATFDCPNLINHSVKTGSVFEVSNLELWTFTPMKTEEDAERNELAIMFRDEHPDLSVLGIFLGTR